MNNWGGAGVQVQAAACCIQRLRMPGKLWLTPLGMQWAMQGGIAMKYE